MKHRAPRPPRAVSGTLVLLLAGELLCGVALGVVRPWAHPLAPVPVADTVRLPAPPTPTGAARRTPTRTPTVPPTRTPGAAVPPSAPAVTPSPPGRRTHAPVDPFVPR